MAGYFSNSGEGDSPNAAKQFEREFADNPGSFGGEGGGIIGRLIGARQPSKITTTVLDDQTPPPSPGGNILSAPIITSVIQRSMRPAPPPPMPPQWSQGAPPAQNGPPMQLPQQNLPNAAPQGPPDLRQQMAVPFQGAGMPGRGMNMGPGGLNSPVQLPMDGMMPPMPQQPPQGAPPPQGGGQPQPQPQTPGWLRSLFSRRPPPPQQAPQSLQMPYNPAQHPAGQPPMPGANVPAGGMTPEIAAQINDWYRQSQKGPGGPGNYAQGGYLRMMRGGYPADLMMGMPMRRDYAQGSYVSEDGQGDGRSDHVEARLSPGEWVADAETVSMLGNGSNEAGARKLEQMRQGLRRQKGKALAKGKFSPDAKSPEAYMRGKS